MVGPCEPTENPRPLSPSLCTPCFVFLFSSETPEILGLFMCTHASLSSRTRGLGLCLLFAATSQGPGRRAHGGCVMNSE